MTKTSVTSKKNPIRARKLILILVLAEVLDLVVGAIAWSWYPSMPLVFRLVMAVVFCLAAWLITKPFLDKISTNQRPRDERNA